MKINKEIRQLSREMLRASFTDGRLDRGKIAALVQSLITKKPRNYINVLKNYKRLLRLEIEKRHARIESASQLNPESCDEDYRAIETEIWRRSDRPSSLSIQLFSAACASAWAATSGTAVCATDWNASSNNFN